MTTNKIVILATLVSLLFIGTLKAQEKHQIFSDNSKIGLNISLFEDCHFMYFQPIDGGGSTDVNNFFAIGIDYLKPLKRKFYFVTGINFAYQQATVKPMVSPNTSYITNPESFLLINIPMYVQQEFLKLFFVNGGILFDFDTNSNGNYDNQTGIGFGAGLGIQHTLKSGIGFYISPYFKIHSALPMLSSGYHQRYIESAIKLGMTYLF